MELIQNIEQFAWIGWIVLILVFFTIETLTGFLADPAAPSGPGLRRSRH